MFIVIHAAKIRILFQFPFNCPSFSLFAEFATGAFVEFATEALLYEVVEAVAEGFELHVVDDLVDEGILQEHFGFLQRNASLTHIEKGSIVELTNGRAMSTLHVVGIDLKHRLGVHTSLFGDREVLIGHLRGSLLSTMLYQHATSKGSNGLIVEHVFVKLVRGAMRNLMGNQRIVIDVLLLVGYHTTIALAFGTLTRESKVQLIAGDTIV